VINRAIAPLEQLLYSSQLFQPLNKNNMSFHSLDGTTRKKKKETMLSTENMQIYFGTISDGERWWVATVASIHVTFAVVMALNVFEGLTPMSVSYKPCMSWSRSCPNHSYDSKALSKGQLLLNVTVGIIQVVLSNMTPSGKTWLNP